MLGKVLEQRGNVVRAGSLLLSYVVMLASGLAGLAPVFAIAALVAVVGEFGIGARVSEVRELTDKVVSRVYRHLARDAGVVLLLFNTVELSRVQLNLVVLPGVAIWMVAVATGSMSLILDRRHPTQALVLNIDLGPLRSPLQLPAWAKRFVGNRLPYVNVLLLPGAIGAAVVGDLVPYVVSAAVALAAAATVGAVVALTMLRSLARGSTRDVLPTAVQKWFDTYRPQVALYSAGPAKDIYQVNMWLRPVEALDQRAVILLRDRAAFQQLAPTRLPVLCVPKSVDFMSLNFESLRAGLYPANVGANIHFLREPGIKHVFVGHGDSDKQASVNPYSKVYDEVWVAGPAGRERYARAGIGVEDRDIVEIGRPQLAGVAQFASRPGERPFTLLYAPTWEGWEEGQQHTSLVPMGVAMMRSLLEMSPPVRIIYKPHPLIGSRGKDAAAAHRRVIELLRAAGGRVGAPSLDGDAHCVVLGPQPDLFACFNEADMLISDVSSVVADFVQSQRPYVVANLDGLPEDEFRQKYPTARAAYLLSTDCGELEKIIETVRSGADPLAEARRELKTYLLGPDEPSPLDRFRVEISRLCNR